MGSTWGPSCPDPLVHFIQKSPWSWTLPKGKTSIAGNTHFLLWENTLDGERRGQSQIPTHHPGVRTWRVARPFQASVVPTVKRRPRPLPGVRVGAKGDDSRVSPARARHSLGRTNHESKHAACRGDPLFLRSWSCLLYSDQDPLE